MTILFVQSQITFNSFSLIKCFIGINMIYGFISIWKYFDTLVWCFAICNNFLNLRFEKTQRNGIFHVPYFHLSLLEGIMVSLELNCVCDETMIVCMITFQ